MFLTPGSKDVWTILSTRLRSQLDEINVTTTANHPLIYTDVRLLFRKLDFFINIGTFLFHLKIIIELNDDLKTIIKVIITHIHTRALAYSNNI